jgi:hypothetical protein
MLPRVALAQNIVSTFLGACVVYLAVVTARGAQGGGVWAAHFVGALGGFIMAVSTGGCIAMVWHLRLLLLGHFVTLCLLATLLACATTALLIYGAEGVAAKAAPSFQALVGCLTPPPMPPPPPSPPPPSPPLTSPPVSSPPPPLQPLPNSTASGRHLLQSPPPPPSVFDAASLCGLSPAVAGAWWDAHLTILGGAAAVLLVFLIFNLVATGYLLVAVRDADGEVSRYSRRRRERRRARRRGDEEEGSGSELIRREER